uniref:(northern house mosquito) hypothetical protein n=1 Tax=Culex pipiens TaxID=7175 RepID=A0A8D8CKE4_CULPI
MFYLRGGRPPRAGRHDQARDRCPSGRSVDLPSAAPVPPGLHHGQLHFAQSRHSVSAGGRRGQPAHSGVRKHSAVRRSVLHQAKDRPADGEEGPRVSSDLAHVPAKSADRRSQCGVLHRGWPNAHRKAVHAQEWHPVGDRGRV